MGASVSTARPKAGEDDHLNLEYLEFKIQENLTSVDETVTKLMKAIDVVHGTAKVLDDYLRLELVENDESTCLDTMKKNLTSCKHKAFTLLFAVEESLTSQQTETIRIMSNFLQFAENELKYHYIIPKDLSFSKELDAYRNTKQREEIQNDKCFQKLQILQTENEKMKKYIKILNARELTFLNAERNHRKDIDLLKEEIERLKNDNKDNHEKYLKQIESNVFGRSGNLKGQNQSLQQEIKTHISEKRHSEQKKTVESLAMETSRRLQKNTETTNGKNDIVRERKAESEVKKTLSADKIEIKSQNNMFESDYQAKCSSWAENVNDLKKQIEVLQNETKYLSEKNETLEQERLNSEEEIERLNQLIQNHKTNINEMQNKIDMAEANIIHKDLVIMQAAKEKQANKQQLEEDEKQRQTFLKNKDRVIDDLKTELQKLHEKYNDEMKDNDTMRYNLDNEFQRRRKEMKLETERLERQIDDLNKEIKKLRTDNEALNERKNHLERQNSELSKEINECRRKNNVCIEDNKKLLTKIKDQETSILIYESYKMELDMLKAKKCIQVQLYSSNRGDMMSGVENELKEMLKNTLESEQLEVEFIQCAKQSELLPDVPVLLLCITASRLGTDVANVTQGLAITPKMALLIFHHKDIHALPSQASERVLTGAELHALGGIFDMAFLTGKGFHNCQMNKNNCVSLVNFIKRESNKKALP